MVIAIDGPAGSGKSAVARLIAKKNGYFLLNSGYFYRAITYKALIDGIDLTDDSAIVSLASQSDISIEDESFLLDGTDIAGHLHDDKVSEQVAKVSSNAFLREKLNEKMRLIAKHRDLVCEGRDMTTVVFPDAEVKVYLDASAKVRAKRRFDQGVSGLALDEIEKSIQNRDEIDKNKAVGALIISKNAHYIDSSNLTLDEVYEKIEQMINRAK